MSEMVERVARATYEARPYGDEHAGDLIWDRLEDGWKDRHRDMARAAIEAMREPTNAMIRAAFDDGLVPVGDFLPGWHSAIDAALAENSSEGLADAVARALLAERERCAKIAERFDDAGRNLGGVIAAAIRKGD